MSTNIDSHQTIDQIQNTAETKKIKNPYCLEGSNHLKWLAITILLIFCNLLLVSCIYLYQLIQVSKQDIQEQKDILITRENQYQVLMTNVRDYFAQQEKAVIAIEDLIAEKDFASCYSLALFYYETKQYQSLLKWLKRHENKWSEEKRKKLQLLHYMVHFATKEEQNLEDIKTAYSLAKHNREDLYMLFTYADEKNNKLLLKKILSLLAKGGGKK